MRLSKLTPVWVSRIAKNELINFLRKNPDEKALSNPFRIKSVDIEDNTPLEYESNELTENKPVTIHKEKLDKALSSLSEREKYVLMTYMQYFDPTEPNRHLPDELLKNICIKFNTTPDNIRQIKSRAIKKMKDNISDSKK